MSISLYNIRLPTLLSPINIHLIKLLSNQEKLVANNERVEEAVNFRNELIKLKKKDNERLALTKRDMLRNLSNKL